MTPSNGLLPYNDEPWAKGNALKMAEAAIKATC